MIRKNSKVKVQIFDSNNKVIKTMVHGEVFNVHEENGKLGITWNKEFKEKKDMTREQRKKELKGNIQLTVIFTMYIWMIMQIAIRLLE